MTHHHECSTQSRHGAKYLRSVEEVGDEVNVLARVLPVRAAYKRWADEGQRFRARARGIQLGVSLTIIVARQQRGTHSLAG